MYAARVRLLAMLPVVIAMLGACGPSPAPLVGFEQFCTTTYDAATGAAGLRDPVRVSVTGWLVKPGKFTVCGETCSFELAEHADGSGRTVRYAVRFGTEENRLQPLTEHFVPEDFHLRTKDGELLGFGDEVRLHGGRTGMAERNDCELLVDLVEKP